MAFFEPIAFNMVTRVMLPKRIVLLRDGPRAARYKWSDMEPLYMAINKWATEVITPTVQSGAMTLFVTGRGPLCTYSKSYFSSVSSTDFYCKG